MSSKPFSDQELAFFEEGDTLKDESPPVEELDFTDLDEPKETPLTWVERAIAVLSLVAPVRSES